MPVMPAMGQSSCTQRNKNTDLNTEQRGAWKHLAVKYVKYELDTQGLAKHTD